MPLKRALIVQYEHGGHRLVYVKQLLQSGRLGIRTVLLLTAEAQASWEYQHHLHPVLEKNGVVVRLAEGHPSRAEFLRYGLFVASDENCFSVIIPEADNDLTTLCRVPRRLRIGRGLRILIMRTPTATARDRLYLLAKYLLAAVVVVRWEGARAGFLTDAFRTVQRRPLRLIMRAVPDPSPGIPTMSAGRARERLGIAPDSFVVGVVGAISERKHPEVILQALPVLSKEVSVLLAGPISPGVLLALSQLPPEVKNRTRVIDRSLTDEEFGAAVSACSAVALLHDLDGPSGVMVTAANAGVPVIVGESRWLRKVTRTHRLGVSSRHDAEDFAVAVHQLMERPYLPSAPASATGDDFASALLD